jgi:archaellin
VVIDFTALGITDVDPVQTKQRQLYAHPYEEFRIELRPAAGAVLTIEKQVPAIYSAVIVIE